MSARSIMEDAETGEQLYVDTHDKRFRQRFARGGAAARSEPGASLQARRGGCAVALDRRRPGARHRAFCGAAAAAEEMTRCHSSGRRCSFRLLLIPLFVVAVSPRCSSGGGRLRQSYGSLRPDARCRGARAGLAAAHLAGCSLPGRAGDPDAGAGAPANGRQPAEGGGHGHPGL